MTIEELNEIVPEDQREAVGTLIEEIKTGANPLASVTDEGFTELLKGNVDLQKIVDARMTKGIDTWQKNNLEKLYQERYAKEHPDETDEQKRIKALEIKAEESERRAQRAVDRSVAVTTLTEAKIDNPTDIVSVLFDEAEPAEKVKAVAAYHKAVVERVTKEVTETLLKNNGRDLDDHDDDDEKYYTIDQLNKMSPSEFAANHEKVQESLKYHESRQ